MKVPPFRAILVRLLSLALLAVAGTTAWLGSPSKSSAQYEPIEPNGSLSSHRFFGSAFDIDNRLYFWLNYTDGDSYATANQHVRAGGTFVTFLDDGTLLLSGQGLMTDQGNGGASVGAVRRCLFSSPFGNDFVFGLGAHWDVTQSAHENTYHQVVGTLEFLMQNWAVRVAGYGLTSNDVATLVGPDIGLPGGGPFFQGNNLFAGAQGFQLDEVAMGGIEAELALSVGNVFAAPFGADVSNDAAEVFLGYYNLQGEVAPQAHGAKGGLRGYVLPQVAANITVSNDQVFGTSFYGGLTWYFGGTGGNVPEILQDKLTIPVQRNYQVAINEVGRTLNTLVQLTQGGNPITVTHVDSNAGGANLGTFEDPFISLPVTQSTDIVYVHADGTYNNQSYALNPNQRFLGEGNRNQHRVNTDQRGFVTLPAGNGGTNRPVIQNSPGVALEAANGSEISNVTVAGAGTAVRLSGLTGSVNVNRALISGGTSGIDIVGGSGTFAFDAIDIDNPTADAIKLTGNSGATITFGNVEIDTPGASGVVATGTNTAVTFDSLTISDPTSAVQTGVMLSEVSGSFTINGGTINVLNAGGAGTGGIVVDLDDAAANNFTLTVANTQFNINDEDAINASVDEAGTVFNANISGITAASNIADTAFEVNYASSTSGTVTLNNNTIDDASREAFEVITEDTADVTVDIDNVNVDTSGSGREAFRIVASDNSQQDVFIDGGTLANNDEGDDLLVLDARNDATIRARIQNVTLDDPGENAVYYEARDSADIHLTATGNVVRNFNNTGSAFSGRVRTTLGTICLNAVGNSDGASPTPGPPSFNTDGAGDPENSFVFEGPASSMMGITQSSVGNLGTDNNGTGAANVSVFGGGSLTTGASCTEPTP